MGSLSGSFLVSTEEECVCVERTVMCLYSQDCGAGVSSVIIRPAEGDSFSHLTEHTELKYSM